MTLDASINGGTARVDAVPTRTDSLFVIAEHGDDVKLKSGRSL
jgi:hypothetical protein